jgi:hypothetical protein
MLQCQINCPIKISAEAGIQERNIKTLTTESAEGAEITPAQKNKDGKSRGDP